MRNLANFGSRRAIVPALRRRFVISGLSLEINTLDEAIEFSKVLTGRETLIAHWHLAVLSCQA
jgi:hypothetical protein